MWPDLSHGAGDNICLVKSPGGKVPPLLRREGRITCSAVLNTMSMTVTISSRQPKWVPYYNGKQLDSAQPCSLHPVNCHLFNGQWNFLQSLKLKVRATRQCRDNTNEMNIPKCIRKTLCEQVKEIGLAQETSLRTAFVKKTWWHFVFNKKM
jgi:hypothetical protein